MRKVPCFNPACWSRRVHHERPDVFRGQVFVEVVDDWDGYAAFCSMTCALEAGYTSLSTLDAPCKKCFVESNGRNVIHHHGTWKCVKPEIEEKQFVSLWAAREEQLQAFREKLQKEVKNYSMPTPVPVCLSNHPTTGDACKLDMDHVHDGDPRVKQHVASNGVKWPTLHEIDPHEGWNGPVPFRL